MSCIRTKIPGPPGTGKTHHLINKYLIKEIEENKIDSKKIAYITFTKAGTEEAHRRVQTLFPEKEFPFICTMHSLGVKQLGIDTTTQLLKDEKWNAFKNFSAICQHLNFESEYDPELGYVVHKNEYMKIIEYARAKKIDVREANIQLDLPNINIFLLEQLNVDLISYKAQTNMIEYSDMIRMFVQKDKCPQIDVVFLDEAQDLNPMQWDMFFYIESRCKRSYVAGDDDQTIYTFQGAEPSIFINLKGTLDPKIESRRVPKLIYNKSLQILENIHTRLSKEWKPRDAEGNIFENQLLDNLDLSKGNWMILARTNEMLVPIQQHVSNLGIRFDSKINNLLPNDVLKAYRVWQRLNQGATVGGEEAKSIYKVLNANKKQVKRGFAQGQSLENVELVDIDDLMMDHGLMITGDWEQLDIDEKIKLFMKGLLNSGDDLMQKARIKISTIHSVKGQECDNVVLFQDLGRTVYDAALKNPDPEHRLYFVGVTRAKESLYIMEPTNDYYYTIGEPIL